MENLQFIGPIFLVLGIYLILKTIIQKLNLSTLVIKKMQVLIGGIFIFVLIADSIYNQRLIGLTFALLFSFSMKQHLMALRNIEK